MKLYYCDDHIIPLPPGHKFPTEKYRLLRQLLTEHGGFDFEPAPFAKRETIELVHTAAYVSGFLDGTLEPAIMRRIGFPWSTELVRRTLASVGGTLMATQAALDFGIGGNLAGGTHHAFASEGAGFCVFNDIAIAIRDLLARDKIRRAAVVDLDVHQGDGTALLFTDDPAVLTVSLHSKSNFPSRKQRSGIDVGFPDGTGDEDYLAALEHTLPQVFDFQPEIVFYQSGVDTLGSDKLGKLALTHEGLKRRDQLMLQNCRSRSIPAVITLGGGYSDPIQLTVEAHANTFRLAHTLCKRLSFP